MSGRMLPETEAVIRATCTHREELLLATLDAERADLAELEQAAAWYLEQRAAWVAADGKSSDGQANTLRAAHDALSRLLERA